MNVRDCLSHLVEMGLDRLAPFIAQVGASVDGVAGEQGHEPSPVFVVHPRDALVPQIGAGSHHPSDDVWFLAAVCVAHRRVSTSASIEGVEGLRCYALGDCCPQSAPMQVSSRAPCQNKPRGRCNAEAIQIHRSNTMISVSGSWGMSGVAATMKAARSDGR